MNLKTIADYLTTQLEGTNSYVVTDNVQYFRETMKLNEVDYTPAVVTLLSPFREETGYRESFVFNLHFKVRRTDVDTFYSDLQTFIDSETPVTEDSWYITKTYQSARFTTSAIDNGVEYNEYDLEFTWVYNLSVVGKHSTLLLDTNALPFTSCQIIHDMSYISNKETATNSYRMTNDIVVLKVPLILSYDSVTALYGYMSDDYYNRTVTLSINGVERTLAIKQINETINNTSETVGLEIKLETAYPRVTLTLDGDVIPNSAYHFNSKRVLYPSSKVSSTQSTDNQKAYVTSLVKSWSITLVKDSSAAYTKVEADAYGDTINTTYTLVRDSSTFTVILADVVEKYTETGDMALECQFIEYGG